MCFKMYKNEPFSNGSLSSLTIYVPLLFPQAVQNAAPSGSFAPQPVQTAVGAVFKIGRAHV